MAKTHVSVIVPAHNEEKYVKRCIESIKKASTHFKGNVEIIVVCNRCIARVRNAGTRIWQDFRKKVWCIAEKLSYQLYKKI